MRNALAVLILMVMTTADCNGEPLTLQAALTAAQNNSPLIVEADQRLEAAKAKTAVVQSAWWPQVNLVADWNKGRSFLTALGSIKETEVGTAGLQLRHTLYDFGRIANVSASQQATEKVFRENSNLSRQDLALRVHLAYWQALAVRSQFRVASATESLRRQLYEQALQFYQQGLRPKVETLRVEANLHSASALVLKADTAVVLADLELARLMGQRDLGGKIPVMEPVVLQPLPALSQALETGLRQRKELARSRYEHLAAEKSTKAARSGHLPILAMAAGAGYADKYLPPDGGIWNIGITLTIPVFSGFGTSSQVREAQALQRVAKARADELQLQIAAEIEATWRTVQEVDSRYQATAKAKEAADEQARLSLERYRQGVGSMIEASDAQVQAYSAENENIITDFERLTARALFARALGESSLGAAGEE